MAKDDFYVTQPTNTSDISGEIGNGDNIIVQSTLTNNTGLNIVSLSDDDAATITLDSNGVVVGGIIDDYGMGLVASGGTLQDVTYAGDLDVQNGSLFIDDGFTAEALSGVSAAALSVDDSVVYFDNRKPSTMTR